MLSYNPTPIQEIQNEITQKARVKLLIKREDLNHPLIAGNKWWKLKYNLEEAKRLNHKTLLTFGGAYSNHIYATAAAAHELGFASIGIIRGEETLPLNPTLTFAKEKGMRLHYVSREQYRKKMKSEFIKQLQNQFGDFYLIPEGGTNELAVKGVTEFAGTLPHDVDYICSSCGTGGTLAGLINGSSNTTKVIGFSALKGGEFLNAEVAKYVSDPIHKSWEIKQEYHFGGYAKVTAVLQSFINEINSAYRIPLEFIYTAKALYGIFDLLKQRVFREGSTCLMIHSGGLQLYN